MKDGRTRRLAVHEDGGRAGFLATHSAAIVFASGPLGGSEVALEKDSMTLGRGAGVDVMLGRGAGADVVIDHASISHEHAVLELCDGGYRLRDLGSTNGVKVNGAKVSAADLKHGDRFELGSLAFRYVVEERSSAPPTHVLLDN